VGPPRGDHGRLRGGPGDHAAERGGKLKPASRSTDWLLVDASSLIFRAFFGIPLTVQSPEGKPVNAVRGFVDMLARLVTARDPRYLLVATDEDWRPAFRVDAMPGYKAHRVAEPIPPKLIPQMPIILDLLAAIGIEILGLPGYEAEDIIASLLPRLKGKVEIVSSDRDLFSLVRDPDVRVLYTQQGIGQLVEVDEAEITRRYGIPGRAYGDFAILRGDPSDGLPGLPGVGAATAASLLRRHGDLNGLLASGRLRAADAAYVERARRVAVPVSTAPVDRPRGRRPREPARPAALEALDARYGLAGSTRRLVEALKAG